MLHFILDKSRQKSLFSFFSKRGKPESDSEDSVQDSNLPSTSAASEEPTVTASEPTPPEKKTKQHSFREQWRKDFTWLETDESMTMFCSVCIKTRQKNGFTPGSRNYQLSALTEHSKSASHKVAVTTCTGQTSVITHSDVAYATEREALQAQLRTVLCMAKYNMPSSNFPYLVELQRINGLQSLKNATELYTHHQSVSEMEKCLADVTNAEIKQKLNGSDFVGIIIDETLNCTLDKKLILYA